MVRCNGRSKVRVGVWVGLSAIPGLDDTMISLVSFSLL